MSNQENDVPSNIRPVKNIKGLLRFCMEATRSEDAPHPTDSEIFEPLTEERKKWLENALACMTVNPVERMMICLTAIEEAEQDTESGTEQQIRALTELQEWAEDLDIAGDFIKINGLRIVPKLLSSEVSELRWRCLELLGNLAQNNPTAQTALLTLKLLPAFLLLADTDPNPKVQIKALYAISCLVRSNTEAHTQLLAHDGLVVFVRALGNEEEKLKVKAAFLVSAICNSNPALKDNLVAIGAVEQLVSLLKEESHGSTHEHVMSALLTLVTDHTKAWEKCSSPELGVKSLLQQRIQFLEGKEQYEEEREYAQQLLKLLNSPSSQVSTHASPSNQALTILSL
ncbi:unnamed protein product [Lymnaea stagnalis]|uniref:Nucleotide exchange factor Fes1 domain-containing protein n=1 Tax=Lymnaea stagnalis TaxID=6523 RepID=A0AAV2HMV9_LYMST